MADADGRRISQQAFAHRLGVHVITVSSWERGRARPSVQNLVAIATETGKPISFFMGDGEDDEEDDRALRAIAVELVNREQDDLASALLDRVRLMKARREARQEA